MDRDMRRFVQHYGTTAYEAVRAQLPRMQLLWLDAGHNDRGNDKDWVEQTTPWRVVTVKGSNGVPTISP
jgi:hypothetical protein